MGKCWLIAYDITDHRRLARLHRFLSKQATPVQYSLFHYQGSTAEMSRLIDIIRQYIDRRSDDVRTWALPNKIQISSLGPGRLPTETQLLSAPPFLHALLHDD